MKKENVTTWKDVLEEIKSEAQFVESNSIEIYEEDLKRILKKYFG